MNVRALALAALVPCLAFSADWDKDKISGNPSAPVAIEIYSSFDCPHCKLLHEGMLNQIMHDLVTPGKAVVVSKEYPLSGQFHKYAREAANYATAAARIGKYQQVADALFKNQQAWAESGKVWDTVSSALSPTEQAKVKTLATDPGVVGEVERDYQQGSAQGLSQTPTLLVINQRNGRKYPFIGVPPNYDLFRDFILKDLK
jgi:protein-disulfide isomerase